MKQILCLLMLVCVAFTACDDTELQEENGKLRLVFKTKYNGQYAPLYSQNITGDTLVDSLEIARLEFFLSNIALKANRDKIVADVAYLDFKTIADLTAAEDGISIELGKVAPATYTGISWLVGLPDSVNAKAPGDFPTTSPLSVNGRYWASWDSYILSKIEGRVYDKRQNKYLDFLYHSGVNGMAQEADFSKSFEIKANETTTLTVIIDMDKFLFATGSTIDPTTEPETHSGQVGSADYDLAKRSIQNLTKAMQLN